MVDIAFGPEPGKRPDMSDTREAYLEMARRKRMYGGILLVLFVAFMASGWMLAEERNAGGFWNGLPQIFDFPAEVSVRGLGQTCGHPRPDLDACSRR